MGNQDLVHSLEVVDKARIGLAVLGIHRRSDGQERLIEGDFLWGYPSGWYQWTTSYSPELMLPSERGPTG